MDPAPVLIWVKSDAVPKFTVLTFRFATPGPRTYTARITELSEVAPALTVWKSKFPPVTGVGV